jgi:Anti-sigma factor NepR
MNEEKGQWRHPRLSDRDLLLCIGRDLRRLYEETLRQSLPSDIEALLQKIEQAELERTVREQ